MTRLGKTLIVAIALLSVPGLAHGADVIAERTLPRGTVVTADDITNSEDASDLIGLETIRTVRIGSIIEARHLQTPRLVRRNEMVTLIFTSGRLRMETKGRSLGEGGEGDVVTVMNSNSRKRVSGRVIGPGQVEVTK